MNSFWNCTYLAAPAALSSLQKNFISLVSVGNPAFHQWDLQKGHGKSTSFPSCLVWQVHLHLFLTLYPDAVYNLLPSPPHGSKCSACHAAALLPVHGNVQLPQRGMRGNPVLSLALGMIICNHSHIPAKELHHTRLQSSRAAACDNHSSSFNYCLKSLRTF